MSSGESELHEGPAHAYWSNVKADHPAARAMRALTSRRRGKTIDLATSRNGQKIAFEIATGNSDAAANIQTRVDARMDSIFVVATSGGARDALLAGLRSPSNVDVVTGGEMLKKLLAM